VTRGGCEPVGSRGGGGREGPGPRDQHGLGGGLVGEGRGGS
jgi:hypothetical protein